MTVITVSHCSAQCYCLNVHLFLSVTKKWLRQSNNPTIPFALCNTALFSAPPSSCRNRAVTTEMTGEQEELPNMYEICSLNKEMRISWAISRFSWAWLPWPARTNTVLLYWKSLGTSRYLRLYGRIRVRNDCDKISTHILIDLNEQTVCIANPKLSNTPRSVFVRAGGLDQLYVLVLQHKLQSVFVVLFVDRGDSLQQTDICTGGSWWDIKTAPEVSGTAPRVTQCDKVWNFHSLSLLFNRSLSSFSFLSETHSHVHSTNNPSLTLVPTGGKFPAPQCLYCSLWSDRAAHKQANTYAASTNWTGTGEGWYSQAGMVHLEALLQQTDCVFSWGLDILGGVLNLAWCSSHLGFTSREMSASVSDSLCWRPNTSCSHTICIHCRCCCCRLWAASITQMEKNRQ